MSVTETCESAGSSPEPYLSFSASDRCIVAVVLECSGRIALFKRSRTVRHDQGLWHCISGFVEAGASPKQQALEELFEECGLEFGDLISLKQGPALVLADDSGGESWRVHTFTATSGRRRLGINWEHESYRWTRPEKLRRFFNRVTWLDIVLEATGHVRAPVHPC